MSTAGNRAPGEGASSGAERQVTDKWVALLDTIVQEFKNAMRQEALELESGMEKWRQEREDISRLQEEKHNTLKERINTLEEEVRQLRKRRHDDGVNSSTAHVTPPKRISSSTPSGSSSTGASSPPSTPGTSTASVRRQSVATEPQPSTSSFSLTAMSSVELNAPGQQPHPAVQEGNDGLVVDVCASINFVQKNGTDVKNIAEYELQQEENREEKKEKTEQKLGDMEGELRKRSLDDGGEEATEHLAQSTRTTSSLPSTSSTAADSSSTSAPRTSAASVSLSSVASEPQTFTATSSIPTTSSAERVDLGEKLLNAAKNSKSTKLQKLVDAGADVNVIDYEGRTPLMIASRHKNATNLTLLLKSGADVNMRDSNRKTALHHAAQEDTSGRCVRMLLDKVAEVDCQDEEGRTPLHLAAMSGNLAAVRKLLKAGASKKCMDIHRKTPFDYTNNKTLRTLLHP